MLSVSRVRLVLVYTFKRAGIALKVSRYMI